jgi:hypothetical protein
MPKFVVSVWGRQRFILAERRIAFKDRRRYGFPRHALQTLSASVYGIDGYLLEAEVDALCAAPSALLWPPANSG